MTTASDDLAGPRPNWPGLAGLVVATAGLVALVAGVSALLDGDHHDRASADIGETVEVAAIAAPPTTSVPPATTSTAPPEPPPPPSGALPLRVRIPRIEVDAPVVDLGLTEDGALDVPTDFDTVGWYTGRSAPGDGGTSVLAGHVDDWDGPAVFFHLRHLEQGDLIEIERDDGLVATYRVEQVEMVDKDDFPTERVYTSTAEPRLRLLTCGGVFDHDAQEYLGNLVVFAQHVENRAIT